MDVFAQDALPARTWQMGSLPLPHPAGKISG